MVGGSKKKKNSSSRFDFERIRTRSVPTTKKKMVRSVSVMEKIEKKQKDYDQRGSRNNNVGIATLSNATEFARVRRRLP